MKRVRKLTIAVTTGALAVLGGAAGYAQDKYSLVTPSGIAFWRVHDGRGMHVHH
jgi:hypothetical protein